jgi:hypothetical protein
VKGTSTEAIYQSLNDTLKMYLDVDRMESRQSLLDELVTMVDVIVDEARSEGWSDGYFEAGGLS